MWLFTKYGFYSTVTAHGDINKIMVRSRDKKHLENLIDRFPTSLAPCKILTTKDTDYKYRIIVNGILWSDVVEDMALEIDYSNFKNEATKLGDKKYMEALHEIWAVMYDSTLTKPRPSARS